jgi:hypothetical protein
LLMVISWSFKYFANSFVVSISPIKNSIFAYSLNNQWRVIAKYRFLPFSSTFHEAQSYLFQWDRSNRGCRMIHRTNRHRGRE